MTRKNKKKLRSSKRARSGNPSSVPKMLGADIELGCCIVGLDRPGGTGYLASQALLREMPGAANPEDCQPDADGNVPNETADEDVYNTPNGYSDYSGYSYSPSNCLQSSYGAGWGYGYANYNHAWSSGSQNSYNPSDWGRKWLINAACTYIDMGHLEVCTPEVLSAFEHVAAWKALLNVTRLAQQRAQAKLPDGQNLEVLVNNSDGLGNSYGSHTNFLITRRCMENIARRKLHYTLFLASHFASSIVYTGAGKVGSENGPEYTGYQLSQRADFYESITGVQTTHNRPIVNLRDETLCGPRGLRNAASWGDQAGLARAHMIFSDNTMCDTSTMLKMGVAQIVFAMLEQEQVDTSLILDSPLSALHAWSRDPGCRTVAPLINGQKRTAVEFQQELHQRAKAFVDTGRADGIVPRVGEIIDIWGQTLEELRAGDVDALVGKLDHVLKRTVLEDVMAQRGLDWDSEEIRYLDQTYGSLKPAGGIYNLYADQLVKKLVPDSQIERLTHEPPTDTRAYLRGVIVRLIDEDSLSSMDWDQIRFKFKDPNAVNSWSTDKNYVLSMADPLGLTQAECAQALSSGKPIQQILTDLGMVEADWSGRPLAGGSDTASSGESSKIVLAGEVSSAELPNNNPKNL